MTLYYIYYDLYLWAGKIKTKTKQNNTFYLSQYLLCKMCSWHLSIVFLWIILPLFISSMTLFSLHIGTFTVPQIYLDVLYSKNESAFHFSTSLLWEYLLFSLAISSFYSPSLLRGLVFLQLSYILTIQRTLEKVTSNLLITSQWVIPSFLTFSWDSACWYLTDHHPLLKICDWW